MLWKYEILVESLFKEQGTDDHEIMDNDDEEMFFKDNFDQFNFPHEKRGSFTVSIKDYLADTWQQYIEHLLGEPRVKQNSYGTECDRKWKVNYAGI